MTLDNGPHIVPGRQAYLERRVAELKDALDLAQQRIDDLEKAMGIGDDLTPLRLMGFTPDEAKVVRALERLPIMSRQAGMLAIYGDDPDRRFDVGERLVDVVICKIRAKLRRIGVELDNAGYGLGWSLTSSAKARLSWLIATRPALTAEGDRDQRHAANRRPRMAMAAE